MLDPVLPLADTAKQRGSAPVTKLLIAAYALTEERRGLLRFPAMEWNKGVNAIEEAYYAMNRRTDQYKTCMEEK